MISSKGGELYIQNQRHAVVSPPTACVSWWETSQDAKLQKVRGYEVLSETWYILITYNYCLHFVCHDVGQSIRSPMLGFLSATWPNGLFAPAASQTNRCASNLGVVVIGDILSSMTWLLPGGGKIKPRQCMAEISKSLWVGRSCFIQLLC